MKITTRMETIMVNGLIGMKMDRRSMKQITRMGKGFPKNVGMKMGMKKNVINSLLNH